MTTPKSVTSQVETRWTFFLPIQGSDQYRHLSDTRTWRHESKLTEEDKENTGAGKFKTEIADNIIGQLFGMDKHGTLDASAACALIETCDGPDWTLTVDAELCPYTRNSLERAFTALCDLLNSGEDFFADKPYVHNRSGNPEYNDPETLYNDFDVPHYVRRFLNRKRPRKT